MYRISFWISLLILSFAAYPWAVNGLDYWSLMMTNMDHCPELACDFKRHYFPQAVEVFYGSDRLIRGWYYPPALALYLAPIVNVDDPIFIWTVLNCMAAFGLAILIAKTITKNPTPFHYLVSVSMVLTSLPVWHSIKWGQISLILCLLICVGLLLMERIGGILIGICISLKGYPIVAVILPLMQSRKKTLLWAIVTAVAIGVMIPMALMGLDAVVIHFENMFNASQTISGRAPSLGGQSFTASMNRWFVDGAYSQPHLHPDGYPLVFPLSSVPFSLLLALTISIFTIFTYRTLRKDGVEHALKVAVFLCWLGLILPPGWHHYFCFLPFAMVIIWQASELLVPRLLLILAFLMGLPPLILTAQNKMAYFNYSAFGGTTLVCLLTLVAGIWIAIKYAVMNKTRLYESSLSNVSTEKSANDEKPLFDPT